MGISKMEQVKHVTIIEILCHDVADVYVHILVAFWKARRITSYLVSFACYCHDTDNINIASTGCL